MSDKMDMSLDAIIAAGKGKGGGRGGGRGGGARRGGGAPRGQFRSRSRSAGEICRPSLSIFFLQMFFFSFRFYDFLHCSGKTLVMDI